MFRLCKWGRIVHPSVPKREIQRVRSEDIHCRNCPSFTAFAQGKVEKSKYTCIFHKKKTEIICNLFLKWYNLSHILNLQIICNLFSEWYNLS